MIAVTSEVPRAHNDNEARIPCDLKTAAVSLASKKLVSFGI